MDRRKKSTGQRIQELDRHLDYATGLFVASFVLATLASIGVFHWMLMQVNGWTPTPDTWYKNTGLITLYLIGGWMMFRMFGVGTIRRWRDTRNEEIDDLTIIDSALHPPSVTNETWRRYKTRQLTSQTARICRKIYITPALTLLFAGATLGYFSYMILSFS